MKSNYIIVVILTMGFALSFFTTIPVFAIDYTERTLTGQSATLDTCVPITTSIVSDVTYIWVGCGPSTAADGTILIYRLLFDNPIMLNNTSAPSSAVSGIDFLPCYNTAQPCLLILDGQDLRKYAYSVSDGITSAGVYNPGSCSFGSYPAYDALGYLWFPCSSEDSFNVMNPVTMAQVFQGPDLTTGGGNDCDGPNALGIDRTTTTSTKIGFLLCSTTPDRIVSFTFSGTSTITFGSLIDFEAGNYGSADQMFVDGVNNRVITTPWSTANSIDSFTYVSTDGSAITPEVVNLGQTSYLGRCYANMYLFTTFGIDSNVLVCPDSTNNIVDVFKSTDSGFTAIASQSFSAGGTNWAGSYTGETVYVTDSDNDSTNPEVLEISELFADAENPVVPPGDNPNIISGVNCSLPENENKLICRVTDPIGGAGNFVIGNGTSGLTGIGCSIGLVDCTNDTNPRTNGLGLLIFLAALFVILGSFYYTIGKETFNIPVFIWIVIILALSAFFTITGLIDPIFLILTVVAVIALAANKLKALITGGNTLGGGTTA